MILPRDSVSNFKNSSSVFNSYDILFPIKNVSMEHVSDSLGHSDLKTTKNYFAGFEDKTKKMGGNYGHYGVKMI